MSQEDNCAKMLEDTQKELAKANEQLAVIGEAFGDNHSDAVNIAINVNMDRTVLNKERKEFINTCDRFDRAAKEEREELQYDRRALQKEWESLKKHTQETASLAEGVKRFEQELKIRTVRLESAEDNSDVVKLRRRLKERSEKVVELQLKLQKSSSLVYALKKEVVVKNLRVAELEEVLSKELVGLQNVIKPKDDAQQDLFSEAT